MRLDYVQSTMRVTVAEAIADVLVSGADECNNEGCPLSRTQQVTLLRNAMLTYRIRAQEAEEMLAVDAKIDDGSYKAGPS